MSKYPTSKENIVLALISECLGVSPSRYAAASSSVATLAYFVTHLMFENCLQKAIRDQDEAAERKAQNLAAS